MALDHEDEIAKILRIVRALDLDPGDITLFVRLQTRGPRRLRAVEEVRRGARPCGGAPASASTGSASAAASASMSAARSRIRRPTSARSPRPTGCATAPACRLPGSTSAAASRPPTATIRAASKPEMPSLPELMAELRKDIAEWGFADVPLIAEPGRVIVARCLSLIVRVLLKKGRRLYINDGIWASLSDSWTGKITLPARFIPDPARKRRSGNPRRPRALQGLRRDLRFRRHPVAAVLAAGDGRHRRLDRDRPYRRLQPRRCARTSTASIPTPSSRWRRPFEDEAGQEAFAAIETMAD